MTPILSCSNIDASHRQIGNATGFALKAIFHFCHARLHVQMVALFCHLFSHPWLVFVLPRVIIQRRKLSLNERTKNDSGTKIFILLNHLDKKIFLMQIVRFSFTVCALKIKTLK